VPSVAQKLRFSYRDYSGGYPDKDKEYVDEGNVVAFVPSPG
jgi:hypothetical protein